MSAKKNNSHQNQRQEARGRKFTPFRRNRVKFVEEQYAWFGSTSPLKEFPNRLFARADIFVQQLRALDANEIQATFLHSCRGKQSLPTTGVSIEQKPTADSWV